LEPARSSGVSIGEAIKVAKASRNTLKQLFFRVLVERGTLSQHGCGRGDWHNLRQQEQDAGSQQPAAL